MGLERLRLQVAQLMGKHALYHQVSMSTHGHGAAVMYSDGKCGGLLLYQLSWPLYDICLLLPKQQLQQRGVGKGLQCKV